jgi:hypothetical protein
VNANPQWVVTPREREKKATYMTLLTMALSEGENDNLLRADKNFGQ